MREREINELILQIFEEQEEMFYFPIHSQKDAKAFVKALNTKGLGYEKLCDDIGESEHSFNSWRKSLGRTGVGQRVIERINQPFIELLEEDADQLMTSVTHVHTPSPTKHHNGCQNGVSPRQSPVRTKRESPSQYKNENENELAERLNRARYRLQESSKKENREKKRDEEKDDGSEEEVFATANAPVYALHNSVGSPKLRREEKHTNERPISQIEEVRMNLRRSSGNVDAKLKDYERRGSLRDKDNHNEGVESCRNSVHGLLAKFENIADNKRQSNNVSPCNSSSKSNSEENINEVSQGSEVRLRSEVRHRSPSPTLKQKSPFSSPRSSRSSRSSQSPEQEVAPIKESESEMIIDTEKKTESESTKKIESDSKVTIECEKKNESGDRKRKESESKVIESESKVIESESKVIESESKKILESDSKKRNDSEGEMKSESESKKKNESESERKLESESKRKESEVETRNESISPEALECDSFVTANGSQREDEYCSFDEDDQNERNGATNHVDAVKEVMEETVILETSAPMSPHRESLKEKEERLAEEVKAEVTNLRKQLREQFDAARKKKAEAGTITVKKDDVDVDENYNSDLDPDNEDQSPVMSKLVQKISSMRTNTKNGPGYLYVFSDSYDENARVKIGTSRFPDKRLRQAQVFNPDMWQILAQPVNQRISALEDLAASLADYAEPKTKYWYRCDFDKVIEAAEDSVSKFASKTLQQNDHSTC